MARKVAPMSPTHMISLRNVEKFFPHGPSKSFVLRRVNLEIREGEFLSIMGPSGAGKSTLLHLIGMHDSDWTGEYHLLDHAVHTLHKRDRGELYKRAEHESIVADALDRFHIFGKKDLYPNQLSGGQQQLVGVARAMIASPKVILADEPTGNLHSNQGREVMAYPALPQAHHRFRFARLERPIGDPGFLDKRLAY